MLAKRSLPIFIFFFASAIEIGTHLFSWADLHLIFKPLIMIGLIGHYLVMSPKRSTLFITALVCCWIGDVLLIFVQASELFFIGGLVSFLIGHVIYIFCYRQLQASNNSNELLGSQKFRFSFPIILAGTGLVVILYPSLGVLKIPVMIYALAITLMTLNALFRYGRTSMKSFIFIFFGAILFMTSDSILAINKFKEPFALAGTLIIITYCAAQFFIVEGAIHHQNNLK